MATPYQHLTLSDRIHIEVEHCKGTSYKDLAKMLDKHPTTIARELRRNSDANGRYNALEAHRLAQTRRSRASSQPRPKTPELWGEFAQTLRQYSRKMSPELYHGRMTQVEGRASLSRSWGCTSCCTANANRGEIFIPVYLAKVESIANGCPVMPVAAKSRTGSISTNVRRQSMPATPQDIGKWTPSSDTVIKGCC